VKSRWNDADAPTGHPLDVRAYSSRLIGGDRTLVLHGGGNTSVKAVSTDRFGEDHDGVFVKASGFDLATMGVEGFTGMKRESVTRLAELETLSDADMVAELLRARFDPTANNPSIEAIVHGLIPYTFVDHTHADAIVTVSNLPDGQERLADIFGKRVLVLPYVMPGFVLAQQFAGVIGQLGDVDGVVSSHHGLFTFANDARDSYEMTVALVDKAEQHLVECFGPSILQPISPSDPLRVAAARRCVCQAAGCAQISLPATSIDADSVQAVANMVRRGVLTPEHVIHNKPFPALIGDDIDGSIAEFSALYEAYVDRARDPDLTRLTPHPHWALFEDGSVRSFGPNPKRARVSADVAATTVRAMGPAVEVGGWEGLTEEQLRELEYWELEQAKLRRQPPPKALTGKIAYVTGAASGIGRACAEDLAAQGALVVATDISDGITEMTGGSIDGRVVDATDSAQVEASLAAVVHDYGGIDIVVSTVGIFKTGQRVEVLDDASWQASLDVNLTSHQMLARAAIRFLRHGVDPAIVFVASRNVTAPGAGAAAYTVSKAGLTQLMRVLALELAPEGIRVNAVHPDAVFDTALWTDEVLATSAERYGVTVEEYKTRNLLSAEITSHDVASAVTALVDGTLSKTTGAQIPIDGGNERVI
jgi:rhamnose utilization protein RhaD (predicted bifunctional aldolase and dehydrogenase)/NAD(P)-dependent dehydrogenase (short-subunit alcohol dehydrogenase family)